MQYLLKDHCTGQLRKAWQLQPNGDLTKLLFRFIRAKGPHAVAFDKVKGHATLQDVQEGKSTYEDKYGNDKSEQAAAKSNSSTKPQAEKPLPKIRELGLNVVPHCLRCR